MAGAGTVLALGAALGPWIQAMTDTNGGKPCRPLRRNRPLVAPLPEAIIVAFWQPPNVAMVFGRVGQQWRREGQEVHP
jgi:hypothetical protein